MQDGTCECKNALLCVSKNRRVTALVDPIDEHSVRVGTRLN